MHISKTLSILIKPCTLTTSYINWLSWFFGSLYSPRLAADMYVSQSTKNWPVCIAPSAKTRLVRNSMVCGPVRFSTIGNCCSLKFQSYIMVLLKENMNCLIHSTITNMPSRLLLLETLVVYKHLSTLANTLRKRPTCIANSLSSRENR